MSLDTELLEWQNKINKNKKKMQLQRKSISNEDWSKYVETCYPKWWDSEFKNIWYFNIIYYPPNHDSKIYLPISIPFNANRFSTMKEIRYNFNAFITQQHSTLKLCFGDDIYQIIKKYLPDIPNLSNNYIYVHKYLPDDVDGNQGLSFIRYKTNDNLTLNRLMGELPFQNHSIINLRIRSKHFKQNSNDLVKKIYLKDVIPIPIN